MSIDAEIRRIWKRLESALSEQLPGANRNLRPGAPASALARLEKRIGRELPPAFRASLLCHDGERRPELPNALADGLFLLPAAAIGAYWVRSKKLAREFPPGESWEWAESIRDGLKTVHGPVKPLSISPLWLPFADRNGDETLYLDFDPPQGGRAGQVIRVYLESSEWEVLAPNFIDFLRSHLRNLIGRKYRVEDDSLIPHRLRVARPRGRSALPTFLRRIRRPRISSTRSEGDVEIIEKIITFRWFGDGGWVQIKPRGKRAESFPVARDFTRGFDKIRTDHQAVIVVRPYHGEHDRKHRALFGDEKVRKILVAYRRIK